MNHLWSISRRREPRLIGKPQSLLVQSLEASHAEKAMLERRKP